MQYLINDSKQGWQIDSYFDYIDNIRSKLPAHVYAFARDSNNYNFHSHNSLHDAWLEYYTVKEPALGEHKQYRTIEIDLCLLGAYHDLNIFLTYKDVRSYSFGIPEKMKFPRNDAKGHQDILMHEIRINETGLIVHEIEFDRGGIFEIQCTDILHRIEPL